MVLGGSCRGGGDDSTRQRHSQGDSRGGAGQGLLKDKSLHVAVARVFFVVVVVVVVVLGFLARPVPGSLF